LACAKAASQVKILEGYKLLDEYMANNQLNFESDIFLPAIDNIVFRKSISELAKENSFKKCNIITGYNSDEASKFLLYIYKIFSTGNWLAEAQSFSYQSFMSSLQKIYKFFPFYPQLSNSDVIKAIVNQYFSTFEQNCTDSVSSVEYIRRLIRIYSDKQHICQAYDIARLYSNVGQNAYVYNYQYYISGGSIPTFLKDYFGIASNADELIVTSGNSLKEEQTDAETMLNNRFTLDILTYWSNFVKYENPNGLVTSDLITWRSFSDMKETNENGRTIVFQNSGNKIQSGFSENKCDFWNSYTQSAVVTATTSVETTIISVVRNANLTNTTVTPLTTTNITNWTNTTATQITNRVTTLVANTITINWTNTTAINWTNTTATNWTTTAATRLTNTTVTPLTTTTTIHLTNTTTTPLTTTNITNWTNSTATQITNSVTTLLTNTITINWTNTTATNWTTTAATRFTNTTVTPLTTTSRIVPTNTSINGSTAVSTTSWISNASTSLTSTTATSSTTTARMTSTTTTRMTSTTTNATQMSNSVTTLLTNTMTEVISLFISLGVLAIFYF